MKEDGDDWPVAVVILILCVASVALTCWFWWFILVHTWN